MAEKSQRLQRRPEPLPVLEAISVSGFKSIRDEARIDIRPLTILAGANSTGKSSIMQPLLLLKQTLEAPYDPGPLLLDGPNVRFTDMRQLLWKRGAESGRFSVRLHLSQGGSVQLTFAVRDGGGVEISEERLFAPSGDIVLQGQDVGKAVKGSLPSEVTNGLEGTSLFVARRHCLLVLRPQSKSRQAAYRAYTSLYRRLGLLMELLEQPVQLLSVIHLPGLRGNPERTYKGAGIGWFFPGVFQDYVAAMISHWQAKENGEELASLCRELESLGLTWKVRVKRLDATQVELLVGRLPHATRGGAQDVVSVADVGFGVSQSLPVVVALIAAQDNHLVYLEQPEIHLHPRAQVAMAGLLARTAQRGVRLVVETHSSLLLRGVQTLVAKGKLDPALVKLHWFTRGKDGATTVSSADLDKDGAFGDWPEDFGEVELGAERDYLDAAAEDKG